MFECPVDGCDKELNMLNWAHFYYNHDSWPLNWIIRHDGEFIRELYTQNLGSVEIAKRRKYLTENVVLSVVTKLDIKRDKKEALKLKTGEDNHRYGVELSDETKKKISDALTGEKHPLYGRTRSEEVCQNISEGISGESNGMYGYTHTNKHKEYLSEIMSGENNPMYGIKGEDHPSYGYEGIWKGVTGEDNPSYKGGPIKYSSAFRENREDVIQRDGEQCLVCGKTRSENRVECDKDLSVHHIIPRRVFRCEDGTIPNEAAAMDNLITLCATCHIKVENNIVDCPTPTSVET